MTFGKWDLLEGVVNTKGYRHLECCLSSMSYLYSLVVRARNWCYDHRLITSRNVELPVISVGNVTVGGNGKSPFTAYLVQELTQRGLMSVILSRGYGGFAIGPHIVSERDSVSEVGDEALMHLSHLGSRARIVISKKRVAGAKLIKSQALGDVILLDDGFQHRRLERNLDLLLIDVGDKNVVEEFENPKLLPRGRFRENPDSAFRRCHAIVFVQKALKFDRERQSETANWVNVDRLLSSTKISWPSIPIFRFALYPARFVKVSTGEEFPLESFRNKTVGAMAAIAKPEGFFSLLDNLGLVVQNAFAKPDHAVFSLDEWKTFSRNNSTIVTTAKDTPKLKPFLQAGDELYELILDGEFLSIDEKARFLALIDETVKGALGN